MFHPKKSLLALSAKSIRVFSINYRSISTSIARPGIYEPEDLPPPKIPSHKLVNIRIRGYDFTVLEHYMYYTTKLVHSLGAKVTKRWITPATTSHIITFKPRSTLLQNEYDLNMYERNVQVANISAGLMGLLLDAINSTIPEGVAVTVKPHEPADEDCRYIPDYELNALKAELREMIAPKKKPGQKSV